MSDIPLFPLPLVLLPGGHLQLQIFEPRYLDMVRDCTREGIEFGIVMIEEGEQVLRNGDAQLPAISHSGTTCSIVDFDQQPNGMLGITVAGVQKFVIRDYYETEARLMRGDVEFVPPEDDAPLPDDMAHLAELLSGLIQHQSLASLGIEPDYASALSVGSRLTELIPCSNVIKQRMFELRDPLMRLQYLDRVITEMQQDPAPPS